jgi:hypothetical protein
VHNVLVNEIGIVVVLANLFVFGMVWWHHRACRKGLNAWARTEGLTLLEVRYSWPFQGPDAWCRSRNQTQFRIKSRDARGQDLHGWVTLGTYWGFMELYKVSNVVWQE